MDVRDFPLTPALSRGGERGQEAAPRHVFYWIEIDGLEYRAAKFSHSSRGQLSDLILSDTARRLKLSRAELDDLVDCPLSGEEFRRLWGTR